MTMLRWGILSTAKIAREQMVPAIQLAKNACVSGIASRELGKAEAMAKRFSIPETYGSYEAMLASPTLDAIYIPLPSAHHVDWSIQAANAGKHVLCEKPIAMHASEIEGLIEARDRNQVLISEAFMVTYHPQWHKVRDLIAAGSIGTLKHVQASFTYYNTDPANMRNIVALGGGALPDIGVYPVVATRFATGSEPLKVSATVVRDRDFGTDTYSSGVIEFADFQLTMYVSTQLALRQSIAFHGDAGWIEVSAPFNAGLYDADRVTLHDAGHAETTHWRFAGVNQYQCQVEQFSEAVLTGKPLDAPAVFSLEDSEKNQRVIDALFRAGETGGWETV